MSKIIQLKDSDGNIFPKTIDVYSTSEVKTNEIWIDGRPIYKKTIKWTNSSSSVTSWTRVTLVSDYLRDVISIIGGQSNGNSIPRYESANFYELVSTIGTSYLNYKQVGYNSRETWVTIKYTKTTD